MKSRQVVRQLLIAAVAAGGGVLARVGVYHLGGSRVPYLTFFPAVIAAALFGGASAALLTTAFTAIAAMLWFSPAGDFRMASREDGVGLGLYLISAALIVVLLEVVKRSQQKAAERLLEENGERLRTFVQESPVALAMFDREMRYLVASDEWRKYYGLDGDVIGRSHYDIFPTIPLRWKEAHRRGLNGESLKNNADMFTLPDGREQWRRWEIRPWWQSTRQVGGILIFSEDITQRKRAEQERQELLTSEQAARAEAERASRLKDDFLATVSHELRTPLNAILGWSQLLGQGLRDEESLNEGLEVIERNARAQTQLIEDLLDMSRIVSGKLRLDARQLAPAAFIEAAAQTVKPSADAKGIRLEMSLDPLAGPVSGDPGRLQQVVWNLLSNAIKFTPKGGLVRVLLERVNLHVQITVADKGEGIAPEFVPHIFERFRQADGATNRKHAGLGLGLAIVKQLVDLHGGSVWAESAGQGKGATFCVRLPLSVATDVWPQNADRLDPAAASPAPPNCKGKELAGVTVLVVDDERDARELVKRVLQERGARVITAGSVENAMSCLDEEWPNVLVSDIGMPEVDGYEFMKRLHSSELARGKKIPAIALTAFARSEDRARAMGCGYQMHLSKPVEPQELIARVVSLSGRTGRG